jgi:hypothetical protein
MSLQEFETSSEVLSAPPFVEQMEEGKQKEKESELGQ